MNEKTVEIRMKLPSLNDYIRANRANKYQAAKMKRDLETGIGWFIHGLPRFTAPVRIHFHWVEENKRRDYDNVAFAKKFILDALVAHGKLKDDNRRFVTGFTDTFEYGKECKVIITITEEEETTPCC